MCIWVRACSSNVDFAKIATAEDVILKEHLSAIVIEEYGLTHFADVAFSVIEKLWALGDTTDFLGLPIMSFLDL